MILQIICIKIQAKIWIVINRISRSDIETRIYNEPQTRNPRSEKLIEKESKSDISTYFHILELAFILDFTQFAAEVSWHRPL